VAALAGIQMLLLPTSMKAGISTKHVMTAQTFNHDTDNYYTGSRLLNIHEVLLIARRKKISIF